jgi:hypothetical protein
MQPRLRSLGTELVSRLPSQITSTKALSRTHALAVVSVFLLTSCGIVHQQRINEAMAQFNVDKEACTQGEVTRENAIARRTCIDTALVNRMSTAGYGYMHLIYQMNAADKLAATAFAEGRITQPQYEAVLAKNSADMMAAEAQLIAQDNQRRTEAWARTSQYLQQQQAIDALNRPTYTAPTNTHCRPDYMGGMQCTTF